MEIYFVFFFPRKKEETTHIAHSAKAPQNNYAATSFAKSAILPTHNSKLRIKQLLLFDFQINNSQFMSGLKKCTTN